MKYFFLIFICIGFVLTGCNKAEEPIEAFWGDVWSDGIITWPYAYSPTLKYKLESTFENGGIQNFLNISSNKIIYDEFGAKKSFLAIQVFLRDKEKMRQKKLYYTTHRMPSAEHGTAYFYIALAPESFEKDFFQSKHWKLYIESGSDFSGNQQSGPRSIRKIIPNLSTNSPSIGLAAVPKVDKDNIPYIMTLDSNRFEIRVYSTLVENPPLVNDE